MNQIKVENYAPFARREFISAVTNRAALYGLTKDKIEPIAVKGDVALICGNAFPKVVGERRKKLEEQIKRLGFERVIEAIAYTWFNRFAAIRYMELHGYIDHGYRVLSHPQARHVPEILEHAERIELPGLDKQKVIELKLDATKEAELYRLLLVAQCNALHEAMPFLFERINDETELLLPDNLLHSDSIIRKLVNEIDEASWQEIEIIGWIYQFYISEKKGEVIGNVVKSEDIPAATQIFTPNWIVKYLIQNSLGRKWLMTYPASLLRQKMEFYIEPTKQIPEVMAQLKEITPTSLNPEELKLLDPACGSGHILVEGYDLLKEIYLERGYRLQDIPKLILGKNLFGLEIDNRAAQLASFALMMKARADDQRIFEYGMRPNIVCIQETNGVDIEQVIQAVTCEFKPSCSNPNPEEFDFMTTITSPLFSKQKSFANKSDDSLASEIRQLLNLFENGKTFGSLMRVPLGLKDKLPDMERRLKEIEARGELISREAAKFVRQYVRQAMLLADEYDAVMANPPYMGSKFYNQILKAFVGDAYGIGKQDLYGCFILRNIHFAKTFGFVGMITIPNWMFLSSFEKLREVLLGDTVFESLAHNGRGVWGPDFGSCSFVIRKVGSSSYKGAYCRLFKKQGEVQSNEEICAAFFNTNAFPRFTASSADFKKMPSSPIAYWVSKTLLDVFTRSIPLSDIASPRQGLATADNDRFIRWWYEVSRGNIGVSFNSREEAKESGLKWFPYNKGGEFRRWYGNQGFVVNWENDGELLLSLRPKSVIRNLETYFKPSLSWSKITSSRFSLRAFPKGHIYDVAGCSIFVERPEYGEMLLGCMNSSIMTQAINSLSPTLNYEVGQVASFPVMPEILKNVSRYTIAAKQIVKISKSDWDSYETSWDFIDLHLLRDPYRVQSIRHAFAQLADDWKQTTLEVQALEEENNRIFIEAYGLQHELKPGVPLEEITLTCNPRYRYGGDKTEEELQVLQRANTMKELLSYSVGCMMGRYCLDKTGLVYANVGNEGFEPSQCKTFPADDDGIVPVMDLDWFEDDATNRFIEFAKQVWGEDHLDDNIRFVAENLDHAKNEHPVDTIHRYFSAGFYKDHLKTYKKRPIYWLFTSGKQRAFQCLVYLHRYNEGTLSRMRTEYVIPLQGKINARIEHLVSEIAAATGAQGRRLEKERDQLERHRTELLAFDELLRHYADQRIKLELDDGVRVNYGKFGKLLAEVDKVTGGGEE
jgi:hypothetical protein